MRTRLAICFALGAVLGTLLDGIHAYGDVLSYDDRAFGRWAWFVPLEFGLLGVAVALVTPALERGADEGARDWSLAARLSELFLFAGLYLLTALIGDEESVLLTLVLAALAIARLAFDGAPGDWLYVVLAAALGPAAEAVISALGAFEYLNPDLAGIPLWLPALWANAGFLVRRLIAPIARPARKGADRW